jgi:hypothetical protein
MIHTSNDYNAHFVCLFESPFNLLRDDPTTNLSYTFRIACYYLVLPAYLKTSYISVPNSIRTLHSSSGKIY